MPNDVLLPVGITCINHSFIKWEKKTFQIGQMYPANRSESKHPLKKETHWQTYAFEERNQANETRVN